MEGLGGPGILGNLEWPTTPFYFDVKLSLNISIAKSWEGCLLWDLRGFGKFGRPCSFGKPGRKPWKEGLEFSLEARRFGRGLKGQAPPTNFGRCAGWEGWERVWEALTGPVENGVRCRAYRACSVPVAVLQLVSLAKGSKGHPPS